MSLIKCKDCDSEVSTSAEKCPRCGGVTDYGKLLEAEKTVSQTAIASMILGTAASVVLGPGFIAVAAAGYAMKLFQSPLARYYKKSKDVSPDKHPQP